MRNSGRHCTEIMCNSCYNRIGALSERDAKRKYGARHDLGDMPAMMVGLHPENNLKAIGNAFSVQFLCRVLDTFPGGLLRNCRKIICTFGLSALHKRLTQR